MHEGCSGSFKNGMEVVDKIRSMGFNKNPINVDITIKCENCDAEFKMDRLESKCPSCNMVYGVTPCSVSDPSKIQAAGINY